MSIKQTVIGPASKKQEMFLNSDATITLAGGAAGCYDSETEYLSERGWVKFPDYLGEKVAQYDPKTDMLSFVTPQEVIKLPTTGFKRMSARGLDFCLSKSHRIPYWDELRKTLRVLPFSEVVSRHEKSKTKGWTGQIKTTFKVDQAGLPITEGQLRLQIAIQADGRVVKNGKNNYTQMRFSKERKYLRLLDLCKQFNLPYKDNGSKVCLKNKNNTEYEVIVWPESPTKLFCNWWGASQEQLSIIIDEVRHWDASDLKNPSGTVRYFTKQKENADFIQYAFHACGYNTSLNIDKRDGNFTVNASFRGKGFRSFANKDGKVPVEDYENHDGFMYCFTVPTSFLVVRRNSKIFISGNSGKTYTSLLIALKFMQHPRATGVIFRRNSKMITSPGSIWHEAVNLYTTIFPNLKIRAQALELVFPNGALLKFSHMQHASDMYNHKGGQYSLVIFDEATDFEEEMVVYLLSRMRNAYVNYTPQMFLMTNPDYNSFLRHWIQDYYLDSRGIPLEERAGHKRFFFRQGNSMLWYDTLEEAEFVHGEGAESGISSFTFIGANCRDNPPLLKAQPDYISRLMNQTRVEKERLLDGSWFARQEASGFFKREWCGIVPFRNFNAAKRVRAWDLAFSLPSEQYPNPDWTRGVLMSKSENNVYTVEDMKGMRKRVHDVEDLIFNTAYEDGFSTIVSIPLDPAAAAGAYAKDLQRRLSEKGFIVRLSKPVKSKVTRFAPFSAVAQGGFVQVVEGDWNKEFFDELEIFDGDRYKKDDQADVCSDAFLLLNKDLVIPHMNLQDLSASNPFNFSNLGNSGLMAPAIPETLPAFNFG